MFTRLNNIYRMSAGGQTKVILKHPYAHPLQQCLYYTSRQSQKRITI